jgi:hypothetical protein
MDAAVTLKPRALARRHPADSEIAHAFRRKLSLRPTPDVYDMKQGVADYPPTCAARKPRPQPRGWGDQPAARDDHAAAHGRLT